jgi:hypothetical protein
MTIVWNILAHWRIGLLSVGLMLPLAAFVRDAQTSAQPTDGSMASSPTTQPGMEGGMPSTQPGGRRGFGRGAGGGPMPLWNRLFVGPGIGAAIGPHSNEPERAEAADFIRAHSPNRAALMDMMRPMTRDLVLNTFVVTRYRQLMKFQSTDPELYKVLVQQFEVQDQVLGDMEQMSRTDPSTMPTTEPTAAEQELRDKLTELVDLNIKQRQERLDRLKETLSREEDRLSRDEGRRDFLVEQAYRRAMDDADRLATRLGAIRNRGPATQPADTTNPSAAGQPLPAADVVPTNSSPQP